MSHAWCSHFARGWRTNRRGLIWCVRRADPPRGPAVQILHNHSARREKELTRLYGAFLAREEQIVLFQNQLLILISSVGKITFRLNAASGKLEPFSARTAFLQKDLAAFWVSALSLTTDNTVFRAGVAELRSQAPSLLTSVSSIGSSRSLNVYDSVAKECDRNVLLRSSLINHFGFL